MRGKVTLTQVDPNGDERQIELTPNDKPLVCTIFTLHSLITNIEKDYLNLSPDRTRKIRKLCALT